MSHWPSSQPDFTGCASTIVFPPPEWHSGLPFAPYLRTNYVPTPEEVNCIRSIIGSHQICLRRTDAAVQYHSDAITSLNHRQFIHETYIEDLYALISPFRRLPVDILPLIFQFCCSHMKEAQYLSIDFDYQPHPALVLSRVCHQWRDLALNLPSLWSVIKVSPSSWGLAHNRARSSYSPEALQHHERQVEKVKGRYTKLMAKIEALSSLSKDWPLTVTIHVEDFPTAAFWVHDVEPCLERLVDLILGGCCRWKNLYLNLTILSETSPLLRLIQIASAQLPMLKSLRAAVSIRAANLPSNTAEAVLASAGTTGAESLTKLNVSMRWADVIHLPIQWGRLTHFSLMGDSYWGRPPLTITSAHELLRKCINLVYCTLRLTGGVDSDASTSEGALITLLHLETLNVHGIDRSNCKGLASRLNLPRLHTLLTCFTGTKPVSAEESGLVEWAELYGEQLTTVSFEYNSITQDALVRILSKLSKVSHLTMVGDAKELWLTYDLREEGTLPPALINEAIVRALTPKLAGEGTPAEECFCPLLKSLECRLGEAEEGGSAWLEMVAARREKDVDGIYRIEEVLLSFDCPQMLRMCDELQERGLFGDDFIFRESYQDNCLPIPEVSPHFRRDSVDWFGD